MGYDSNYHLMYILRANKTPSRIRRKTTEVHVEANGNKLKRKVEKNHVLELPDLQVDKIVVIPAILGVPEL